MKYITQSLSSQSLRKVYTCFYSLQAQVQFQSPRSSPIQDHIESDSIQLVQFKMLIRIRTGIGVSFYIYQTSFLECITNLSGRKHLLKQKQEYEYSFVLNDGFQILSVVFVINLYNRRIVWVSGIFACEMRLLKQNRPKCEHRITQQVDLGNYTLNLKLNIPRDKPVGRSPLICPIRKMNFFQK